MTIYKHATGVSPTFSATIDGASVAYANIREVEIFLEVNLHDLLVLHMTSIPPRATADYRGRAVQVVLDNGGNYVHEFDGYVIDVCPESVTEAGTVNGSPFQNARIVCLGASSEMRGSRSKVWAGQRLQDIVSVLADTYDFSADVPNDPLITSTIVQDSESDWEFLVRYAKLMGYVATLHGTNIHVFDPYKAAGRNISYHKLRTGADIGATLTPNPGNISTFNAVLGDYHPDGVYKDTTIAVHQDNGQVFDVSLTEMRGLTSPARFTDRLPGSVDNYEQAARALSAHAKETYDFNAEAEVLGIAGCLPGGLVTVDKYGGEVDGLWFVNSVTHKLNSGIFVSKLGLARNINSELVENAPVQAYRQPPASVAVKGKWATTKRLVNVYS
jgi:phage protein D